MTEESIRSFFDELTGERWKALEDRLDEDVIFEFPGSRFGTTVEGKRRVLVFLKKNQRLFLGGLHFRVHWAAICGDRAVAQWTNSGRTRDGKDYENRGVTIFKIRGGKIASIEDYLDTETLTATWPPA